MSNTRNTRRQPIGGQLAGPPPASKPRMTALPPPSGAPLGAMPPGSPNPSLLLAAALSSALDNRAWQPACARCVARVKASGGEDQRVPQALTWQDGEPVCYGCFRV